MTAKHDGRWDDEKMPVPAKQEKPSVQDEPEEDEASSDGRRWRWALLALVFFVALGGGFLGAGFLHDKSQEAKNDRIQQELIFAKQEESLRKQEAAIRDQREALEREKTYLTILRINLVDVRDRKTACMGMLFTFQQELIYSYNADQTEGKRKVSYTIKNIGNEAQEYAESITEILNHSAFYQNLERKE